MKRIQAISQLTDAVVILMRVRDEYLSTRQAWPQCRNSIQPEIDNLESLIGSLELKDVNNVANQR